MPDQELLDAIATGDLITQVDAIRSDYDLLKLIPALAAVMTARLTDGRAANAAVLLTGGSTAGASQRVADSRARLTALLRNGFNHLRSIPEEDAPAADVVQALETYGWERGLLGDLESPSRIETLARAAGQVSAQLPASLRYPANVLTRITTWLGVLDANKLLAGGGVLQTIIDDKDEKRDLLLKAISRVRFHYCAASDDGDKTPELARASGCSPAATPATPSHNRSRRLRARRPSTPGRASSRSWRCRCMRPFSSRGANPLAGPPKGPESPHNPAWA